jgi:pimeloyl-ACP methyl ester carboxylesterase
MLDRGDGTALAWRHLPGRGPAVVFLPGFRSTMTGEKAEALAGFCAARGQAMLRLDYSGHGASGGRFQDGTIGRWLADALCVLDQRSQGPAVLVGSSTGGSRCWRRWHGRSGWRRSWASLRRRISRKP